jgi:prolyl oligopeptidase
MGRQFLGKTAWFILCASLCLAGITAGCSRHGNGIAPIRSLSCIADTFFYVQTDPASTHETLMARKRTETTARRLLDLESLEAGKHDSNVEILPSGDGKYVAIGVSRAHDGYTIRILNVAIDALLPDSIARSFDGDASWTDSNDTFYYRKFQQVPSGAAPAAIFTNMRAYLHKLGDDQTLDKPVFGPDVNPELHLPVVGAVNAFPLPGTSLLLAVQSSSVKELDSFWVTDTHVLASGWRKVIDHSDDVLFEFSSRGAAFYFITRRNAASGQLMEFDAAHEDFSKAREILPASDLQLTDRNRDGVLCAKDALYAYGHRNGVSALIRVPYDDPAHRTEIELPFAGVIADVSGDSGSPGLVFSMSGKAHPFTVYEYDPSTKRVVDTRLVP